MPWMSDIKIKELKDKLLEEELLKINKGKDQLEDLPKYKKDKIFRKVEERFNDMQTMAKESSMSIKTAAMKYFDFMLKKLKEWHGAKVKTPLQLSKEDRKKFFALLKKEWKDYKKNQPEEEKKKLNV